MKDGGPAFPAHPNGVAGDDGMSLRDYFAAHALAGLMSCKFPGKGESGWQELVAWDAYSIADAMLTERAKATP